MPGVTRPVQLESLELQLLKAKHPGCVLCSKRGHCNKRGPRYAVTRKHLSTGNPAQPKNSKQSSETHSEKCMLPQCLKSHSQREEA